jgi:hypothetical protein
MKLKNLFVCLFVAAMAMSCQKTPEELLTKTWTLDNIDYTQALKEVPAESKEMMKKMMDEQIPKMKGKVIFEFKEDGKVTTTAPSFMGETKKEEGTWTISEDGKTVTITDKERKNDFAVKTLTDEEFSFEVEKTTMKFVPKK